ncbi:hypothetical protein [Vibrio cyclitrophicus]|uniref:hypothetical protein n=1 Tax=Vibrio cyclitrophicus TaxID=47951 RepID=UPI003999F693
MSLRDTEQLAYKFLAVLSSADKSMNPYLLLTLFALRDKHYSVYECWVGSDINATTLQKVMESAGLPLHRGNSGYFVAIEGTEAVDFNLYEMLYCIAWISTAHLNRMAIRILKSNPYVQTRE